MSGLAGILNLDGEPADPSILSRMLNLVSARGPHDSGSWIGGPVGLGHTALHTTPESALDRQPFLKGKCRIIFDGRIDNRDELWHVLAIPGQPISEISDCHLVLLAYERWGEDCAGKLTGDFAFAIWDEAKQTLLCVRDFLGGKPFYYSFLGRTFLFGSQLNQILSHPRCSRKPNEGMVAEYLANNITSTEETLFQGVHRLKPAHLLRVQPNSSIKRRYWHPEPTRTIRYAREADYGAHFFDLLRSVVRTHLRSNGRAGAHLSGGLDSSSIVGMVQSLHRSGELPTPEFETFSLVFPGRTCDESVYIHETERFWNLRCNLIDPGEPEVAYFESQTRISLDFPGYPNGNVIQYRLNERARDRGFRVLLTGMGGNQWIEGRAEHLADSLVHLNLPKFLSQLRHDSLLLGNASRLSLALRFAVLPLLPPIARTAISAIRRKSIIPSWISPDFAARSNLRDRLAQDTYSDPQFPTHAQQALFRSGTCGYQIHGSEVMEQCAAQFSIEERHPLNHRSIVEFALAIPEEQRWQNDQMKFVLRRAMDRFLTDSVKRRTFQADFSSTFFQILEKLRNALRGKRLTVETLGWVNGDTVKRLLEDFSKLHDDKELKYFRYLWPLWMIFGIELWIRNLLSSSSTLTDSDSQAVT